MATGVEGKEPTADEWSVAADVVRELQELGGLTPEQIHIVRNTVITVLIKRRDKKGKPRW